MVTNTQPSMLKQSPRLELLVELVRMIVDLLSDDMSTLAALAQSCSFFRLRMHPQYLRGRCGV